MYFCAFIKVYILVNSPKYPPSRWIFTIATANKHHVADLMARPCSLLKPKLAENANFPESVLDNFIV